MTDKANFHNYLLNVIKAADPEDPDDVRIRSLLVTALRNIGADLTELLQDPRATAEPPLANPAPNRSG
jgi:hypothetical protein